MAEVAHTAPQFLAIGSRDYSKAPREPRQVLQILARLEADPTLRPVMITLTAPYRVTAATMRKLGRDFLDGLLDLEYVELRREASPVGRQHLHGLALVSDGLTDASLVSRWMQVCPGAQKVAQQAVTLQQWASGVRHDIRRGLSAAWSYIRKTGSEIVKRVRRPSNETVRVCSECGASLAGKRSHAVVCSAACRTARYRRAKRHTESAPSRAGTPLRAGALDVSTSPVLPVPPTAGSTLSTSNPSTQDRESSAERETGAPSGAPQPKDLSMAQTDFSVLSGSLTSPDAEHGATAAFGTPNGGAKFCWAANLKSEGLVALRVDLASFDPVSSGAIVSAALRNDGASPLVFIGLDTDSTTGDCYQLGIDASSGQLVCWRGSLDGSSLVELARGSEIIPSGSWAHVQLEVVANYSPRPDEGDPPMPVAPLLENVINVRRSNLSTNTVGSPIWAPVAGMTDLTGLPHLLPESILVDGFHRGAPLEGGFCGYAVRGSGVALVDRFAAERQL